MVSLLDFNYLLYKKYKFYYSTIVLFTLYNSLLCKHQEFFLIKNQQDYQQNNYRVYKKETPYCKEAIDIQLFKKDSLTVTVLSTPFLYDFSRSYNKNIQLRPKKADIHIIDKTTQQMIGVLSAPQKIGNYFELHKEKAAYAISQVVLSGNEQYAAAIIQAEKRCVILWDLPTKREMIILDDMIHCALSPDGSLLAAADSKGIVYLFNNQTKQLISKKLCNDFYTLVCGLEFSTDSKKLIVVAMPDEKYYIYATPPNPEHRIWDNLIYMKIYPETLPVGECYHHMQVFSVKKLLY